MRADTKRRLRRRALGVVIGGLGATTLMVGIGDPAGAQVWGDKQYCISSGSEPASSPKGRIIAVERGEYVREIREGQYGTYREYYRLNDGTGLVERTGCAYIRTQKPELIRERPKPPPSRGGGGGGYVGGPSGGTVIVGPIQQVPGGQQVDHYGKVGKVQQVS